MSEAPRPLDGLVVLDLTTALAGPFATFLLAGLGARVIKIENPLGPDTCRANAPYLGEHGASLVRERDGDVSVSALNRLRNKEAVTLNLKQPGALDVFRDLVARADMVVENFSRGTLDRLGAGYAFGKTVNPKVIYCSITGFGSEGDPGTGKAMDAIIQALSGVMMTSGAAGDPPVRVGVPFADMCAPLFGVIGLLAALHQAQRTGLGQHVDVSMLGVLTAMVAGEPFDLLERCGVPQRTGLTVPRLAPFGTYPTTDGYVAICAPTEAFAKGLFTAIDRPDLYADPKFRTRDDRVRNVAELNAIIEQFTRGRTNAEAIGRLEAAGVPCAPVRNPNEAVRDPQVLARGETVRLAHPTFGIVDDVIGMGLPIRFSGSTAGFDKPAPAVGEHNQAVYGDLLGYDGAKMQGLRERKII
jgi:CoA:oxalate CoA-transferase